MKIFILMGSEGEWSDRTEWPIKAYSSKEKAEVALLKADAEEMVRRVNRGYCYSYSDQNISYFIYYEVDYDATD